MCSHGHSVLAKKLWETHTHGKISMKLQASRNTKSPNYLLEWRLPLFLLSNGARRGLYETKKEADVSMKEGNAFTR